MQLLSSEFLVPNLVSNIISAALVFTAVRWPRVTRVMFVVMFLVAGLFNAYTAVTDPEAYLAYADMAVLDIYRNFITGYLSGHVEEIILAIALGQLGVAALLCGSKHILNIGVGGGVIFFVAIIPLGVGSAFPASLLLAVAIVLMRRGLVRAGSKNAGLTD